MSPPLGRPTALVQEGGYLVERLGANVTAFLSGSGRHPIDASPHRPGDHWRLAAPPLGPPRFRCRATLLRFIPQTDLTVLDPIWTTAYVTRNHAYAGVRHAVRHGCDYPMSPQMVAGHATEDDGLTWNLTLRDGLSFHDGTPVLARDCVASIRRWAARDTFGQPHGRAPTSLGAGRQTISSA